MLEVPRHLLRFESHYSWPREAARTLRICAGSNVLGARHVRQEAVLDAIELDVQSGRVQEIEFCGRVCGACANSASVGGVKLYSQDNAGGVLHRPWREGVGCDADAYVIVHADDAGEPLGGSEVRGSGSYV